MAADGFAESECLAEAGSSVVGRDGDRMVVWLRGEHDAANAAALSETLLQAASLDDGNLIVDLSGVEFLGTASVHVIARTRAQILSRLQLLTLRAPSRRARRVLDACGVAYAAQREPHDEAASSSALGTWVAIPSLERADRIAERGSQDETLDETLFVQTRVDKARVWNAAGRKS